MLHAKNKVTIEITFANEHDKYDYEPLFTCYLLQEKFLRLSLNRYSSPP